MFGGAFSRRMVSSGAPTNVLVCAIVGADLLKQLTRLALGPRRNATVAPKGRLALS